MMPDKLTAEQKANRAADKAGLRVGVGGLSIGDLLFPRTAAEDNPTRKDLAWNAVKDIASLPGRGVYGIASAALAPLDHQSAREALISGLAKPTSPGSQLSDILEDVVKDPTNILSEGAASVARLAKGNVLAKGLARAAALAGADAGTQALNGQSVEWRSPLLAAGTDVAGKAVGKLLNGELGTVAKMYDRPKHPEGGVPLETLYKRNPEGSWRRDNLNQYLKGSDVVDFKNNPIILYHGTSPNTPFDFLQPSSDGAYGYGIYTTDRPRIASGYASAKKVGEQPQVYPMVSSAKDLFDFDSPADWDRLRRGFPAPEEAARLAMLRDVNPNMKNSRVYNSMLQLLDDAEADALPEPLTKWINNTQNVMSDRVHAMGHGGIRYRDVGSVPGDNYNYLIFDPKDLKSVHNPGTWGKRDPVDLMGLDGTIGTGNTGLAQGLARRALGKTESRYLDTLRTK